MKGNNKILLVLLVSVCSILYISCNKDDDNQEANKLQALFIADTLVGESPLTVEFINQSKNADGYYWIINNDTVSEAKDLVYTFVNEIQDTGNVIYKVNLVAFNTNGEQDSFEQKISVLLKYNPAKAHFISDISSGFFPLTVKFTNQSTEAIRYTWFINGDSISDAVNLEYTFKYEGPRTKKEYTVKLLAYDALGEDAFEVLIVLDKKILNDNPKNTDFEKTLDMLMLEHFDDWYLCGASLAIVDGEKVSTYHYGETKQQNGILADNETMYQLASITKTFTGIATIYWLNQQNISLDSPVADFLPDSCAYGLVYEGTQASFRHLLCHTSGLPYHDPIMPIHNVEDYFLGYDSLYAYKYLANNKLLREPGTTPNAENFDTFYGNYAYGLLGFILERNIGKDLQAIFDEIILDEAKMESATMDDIEQFPNKAYPHRKFSYPQFFHFDGIKGHDALNCNLNDLVKYAQIILMNDKTSSLGIAIEQSFEVQYPITDMIIFKVNGIAMPWWIYVPPNGDPIRSHSGSTFGFTSTLDIDIQNNKALILLFNNAPEDIGANDLYTSLYDILFDAY